MSKINPNDPARPVNMDNEDLFDDYPGLTIRQELAARFIQGMLPATFSPGGLQGGDAEGLARCAFDIADAFIRLNNEQEESK